MLNSYSKSSHNSNTSINVSSVPGTIIKSHPKSYFRRAHIKSNWMESLVSQQQDLVILQMMQSHDGFLVMEVVNKTDYEMEDAEK